VFGLILVCSSALNHLTLNEKEKTNQRRSAIFTSPVKTLSSIYLFETGEHGSKVKVYPDRSF